MRQIKLSLFALAGAAAMVFVVAAGCAGQQSHAAPPATVVTQSRLQPGPNDPRIACVAGLLLENLHYLQRPLDKELSARFFDGYINSLDPRHDDFLQSDLAEFDHFRTNLDTLTTGGHGIADLTPAFAIHERFVERFEQRVAYVSDLLQHGRFKFNTDEKIQTDRRHAPFPKDLDEAKGLWRQWVRREYLQEKLADEISETNGLVKVQLNATNAAEIPKKILRHYGWALRTTTNNDSDYVMQVYLNALAQAYDPHSEYFSAPKAVDFSIGMSLSLFGIGATLSEDDGYCTISSLVPGGPAAKSKKLKEKDRILAVQQSNSPPVDVVDMDLEKVVQKIRGPKGTVVRLIISPESDRAARQVISLVRDEIKLEESAVKAKLVDMPDGLGGTNRLGIINVPSFYATIPTAGNEGHTTRSTSADVIRLIAKLKAEKVSGIILDLRSNPGGSLEEAVKFTGLFTKDGPVVLVRAPDGQVKVRASSGSELLYDGPMVVMVNRFSASASEIVAAALQDYGRAIVVGDVSTHGKGTVQNLNELRPFVWPAVPSATNDPGTIKITINKFYRVTGASTQMKGVASDIVLPDIWNSSKQVGEGALDNALAWDTIQPVNFTGWNLVQPYLNTLRTRSEARLASNKEFAYTREDIARFEKQEAEKSVTLNEHEAIKERQTNATRNKLREDERKTRPVSSAKVYELTLKNVDDPGLPQPDGATNKVTAATSADEDGGSPADTAPSADMTPRIPSATDPGLEECEHILQDYVGLLGKTNHLAAAP